MKRALVLGGAAGAAALVAVPVAALAAPTGANVATAPPPRCEATRWTTTPIAAPAGYTPIAALTTGIAAIYPVAVTVSGVVQGQPVALQVIDHWIIPVAPAQPGAVRVTPVGGQATPFSFTWIAPGGSAAVRGHSLTVEWHQVAGAATLQKATVVVSYTADLCS